MKDPLAPRPIPSPNVRMALVTLFVLHMLAVLSPHVPAESALRGPFQRPFGRYMIASGNWQSWDMFDSAPGYHSYDVDLVAAMPDGGERVFGPRLPGLLPLVGFVRDNSYFLRVIDGSYALYLAPYGQAACVAVRAATGATPISVRLRQRIESLRSLHDIRKDGVIGEKKVVESRVMPCPR